MPSRPLLLSAILALGPLAGCSRNAPSGEASPDAPASTAQGAAAARPPSEPGTPQPGTRVYFVRNSGVRCITTPCPFFLASRPERPDEDALMVHELDLSALAVSEEQRQGLEHATELEQGLKVEAHVDTVPDAGPGGDATVLRVTRVLETP
jgi:hypothetical protein